MFRREVKENDWCDFLKEGKDSTFDAAMKSIDSMYDCIYEQIETVPSKNYEHPDSLTESRASSYLLQKQWN